MSRRECHVDAWSFSFSGVVAPTVVYSAADGVTMGRPADQPIRLTRAQVREIDRRSIEKYHIPGVVLMENAARAVADAAMEMMRGVESPAVLIVCGGGNNGGDGLAVARHLHNRGWAAELLLAADATAYRNEAKTNWQIVQAMGLPITAIENSNALLRGGVDLLVDALFGTGLSSAPRDTRAIEMMGGHDVPVLSVDIPSGLDCDTGEPLGTACVRATRTVTFVAEKAGFENPRSRQYLGDVIVGDIGCPRELIGAVAGA
jgi:NAD(P)H-hydrate epimerase